MSLAIKREIDFPGTLHKRNNGKKINLAIAMRKRWKVNFLELSTDTVLAMILPNRSPRLNIRMVIGTNKSLLILL